ncbi:MAG: hypothetical protein QMD46_08400 [Methanomicrobiales archaeon]|nr:hypothetical protein [Methanomicrobiales archaeon]MDI6876267.1 hypothetical protein [Methanomicrobiales archaeon]
MVNRGVYQDRGLNYLASWIKRQREQEAAEKRDRKTSRRRRRARGTTGTSRGGGA